MKITIKNMVCPRCVDSVRHILVQLDIPYYSVQLGEVTLAKQLSAADQARLNESLEKIGWRKLVRVTCDEGIFCSHQRADRIFWRHL